jgi:uncharacterized protein (DUF2336 family)
MTVATLMIPGLDEIVRHGDPERRAEAALRISELFLQAAGNLRSDHVDLFDGLLIDLVPHAKIAERADLAERLSGVANAPRVLVGQLAREDELSIAGPLLRRSPVIDERTLVEIAKIKGQGHLLAMSERSTLSTDLTDVIVRRGDREVVRRAAGNSGAAFSHAGYSTLIRRAGQDGVLTLTVGKREDLSSQHLKDLLAGSVDIIRRRLLEVVDPAREAEIKDALNEIAGMPKIVVESRRDFTAAQRTIGALQNSGALNEAALLEFAKNHKYEESVVALSVMSGVQTGTLDRLITEDRYDPLLIVGKVIGLDWATVRALILLRLGPNRVPSPVDIESARLNYARLMPSTAERVVKFWQTRQSA